MVAKQQLEFDCLNTECLRCPTLCCIYLKKNDGCHSRNLHLADGLDGIDDISFDIDLTNTS